MTPTKNRSRYARGKLFTPQLDRDGQMQNYWLPSRDDQVVVSTLSISDSHLPQIIEEGISLTGMLLTSSRIIPGIQGVRRFGGGQVRSVIWGGHGEGKQSSNQPNFENPPTNVQSTGYVGSRSRVSEFLGHRHEPTVDLWSHQRQLKGRMLPQSNAITDVELEELFTGLTVGNPSTRYTVFLVNDDPSPEVMSSVDVEQWILPHPMVSDLEITDQMSRQLMKMSGMLAPFLRPARKLGFLRRLPNLGRRHSRGEKNPHRRNQSQTPDSLGSSRWRRRDRHPVGYDRAELYIDIVSGRRNHLRPDAERGRPRRK